MHLPLKVLLTNSTTPKASRKTPFKPLLVLWPLEYPMPCVLASFSPCFVEIPSIVMGANLLVQSLPIPLCSKPLLDVGR